MKTVGVVGATGYVGQELCRWLLRHPHLSLAAVVSRSAAGQPLGEAVPALSGCSDLVIQAELPADLDVAVLAVPHGAAVPWADAAPVVVDCSSDHRHAAGWVYGQPEWSTSLAGARRIAAPGCFATALELAIAPFVAAGVVAGSVSVSAATGSTGAGVELSRGTHHPERFGNWKAYKVLAHQHGPEVRAMLAQLGDAPDVLFVPASAPLDRGIFATCFVPLRPGVNARAVVADAYRGKPLVRWREGSPELRHVRGTAFADLAVHQQGDTAIVLVAIDNLGKGAAAQAVQALNIALGHPEAAGLAFPGSLP